MPGSTQPHAISQKTRVGSLTCTGKSKLERYLGLISHQFFDKKSISTWLFGPLKFSLGVQGLFNVNASEYGESNQSKPKYIIY